MGPYASSGMVYGNSSASRSIGLLDCNGDKDWSFGVTMSVKLENMNPLDSRLVMSDSPIVSDGRLSITFLPRGYYSPECSIVLECRWLLSFDPAIHPGLEDNDKSDMN